MRQYIYLMANLHKIKFTAIKTLFFLSFAPYFFLYDTGCRHASCTHVVPVQTYLCTVRRHPSSVLS